MPPLTPKEQEPDKENTWGRMDGRGGGAKVIVELDLGSAMRQTYFTAVANGNVGEAW